MGRGASKKDVWPLQGNTQHLINDKMNMLVFPEISKYQCEKEIKILFTLQDDSPIPKELLDKLIASRIANAGAFNLRQIILGTFDQRIHTTGNLFSDIELCDNDYHLLIPSFAINRCLYIIGKANTQDIFASTYKEIIGIDTIPNTNMPANFGHMVGYDAQYYGYLVSILY